MSKIKYKKVKRLNSVQAAYIAGLIDGEGTITLSHKNINKGRYLAITISNVEYDLLNWVLNTIGAGQITKKRTYKKGHTISYTYQVYSRQALDLLSQIISYLQTYRRKRGRLVLKNYKKITPRNGKYSEKILNQKEKFIKTFFTINGPRKRITKIGTFDALTAN